MPLHVALTHHTSYRYDRAVTLGPQVIRLRPSPNARTPVLSYALRIAPDPHFINWQTDPQGNWLARIVFPDKVTRFEVTVDLVADMATINPFDFFLDETAETWPFAYDPLQAAELAPFRHIEPAGPRLQAFLDSVPRDRAATVDKLVALNQQVQATIRYGVRMEPGVWPPERTLMEQQGSCRDSAWLLVQILRHLGFAARFVSGYLIQLKPDQRPAGGAAGPENDFTDLHAWAEAYLPGAGWVGLDATSGLMTGEGHIPLAATPEPASAAPISGLVAPAETRFHVDMAVRRLRETPRTTAPYSEAQWAAIQAAGRQVDRLLDAGQVRLTMGGEPTFVAQDDPDGPEWNTDAVGPTKRHYAGRLLRRLLPLWAPGAVVQQVAGKHYPGEQLPRWALVAHWRTDNEPVWRNPALLATDDSHDDATAEDARRFATALARHLGLDPALIRQAYEDAGYFLWRENKLPANVTALESQVADPQERARLAQVFGHGLGRAVGSVLPLRRVGPEGARSWRTDVWHTRTPDLLLVPGDAAIGFRLPLPSLAWADPAAIEPMVEPDGFAARPNLPAHAALQRAHPGPLGHGAEIARPVPAPGRPEPDLIRTALTVEPRAHGLLHVFIPPLEQADDWLALVAAIEAVAAGCNRRIVLEGYQPPRDPRLTSFSITPDPGVIEVNVHPASSWPEQVTRIEQLYAAARAVGLTAEKFMLDGRHIGTGGGNHVVMGAARPEDSPFLRRPDLLKSLLGFFHNHPGLSYLFSGLFIGPTSQHPRIDEARQDSVAELEAAFRRISPFTETPPWLTDRLFRNLLADMSGNTHRTEFCIDKLHAPESASGRLGLVEFRAMEMPPHPRMAAAHALLLRAAIAAFWHAPYERRLIRWGTRLHDDFMLPHPVWENLRDALAELRARGVALDEDWFLPQWAFRFPLIGEVTQRGMVLEVRHALEPWPVLGEEPAAGGTVRYVDSSTERLQARVTGWVPERYVLCCNGHGVPLRATDRAGEAVGGVRFKAWNPPQSLHPTVGAQTPMVFDIYDRWAERSIGGLTHHVVHPGGRAYDHLPVNANEAESRRRGRFFPFGHTPGPMPEPRIHTAPEHPLTLDLRRG